LLPKWEQLIQVAIQDYHHSKPILNLVKCIVVLQVMNFQCIFRALTMHFWQFWQPTKHVELSISFVTVQSITKFVCEHYGLKTLMYQLGSMDPTFLSLPHLIG
jgi:hypothetical protein